MVRPPASGALPAPRLTRITYDSGLTCDPALSPDGKWLAYASDRAGANNLDIWVQPVAAGDPRRLTEDEFDESEPSFSPDGTQIVYRSERDGGGLYIVPAIGGEPRLLARHGRTPRFSPDGTHIAYWTGKGGRREALTRQGGEVWLVPAAGGEPRRALIRTTFPEAQPVWSPDGRELLTAGGARRNSRWGIATVANGAYRRIDDFDAVRGPDAPAPAAWTPDGYIWYSHRRGESANLYRVRLDASKRRIAGPPEQLTFGGGYEDAPSFAASGLAAYADLTWNFDVWALPVDHAAGKAAGALERVTSTPAGDYHPWVSEDGRALSYYSVLGSRTELWLRRLDERRGRRLMTLPSESDPSAALSPDGSRIAYTKLENGKHTVYTLPVTGGLPERIGEPGGDIMSWSRDGRIFRHALNQANINLGIIALDPKSGLVEVLIDPHQKQPAYQPALSPNRAWLSFMVVSSAQTSQILIVSAKQGWPAPPERWIPITGSKEWVDKPRWSPRGDRIYYTSESDGYRCLYTQRIDPTAGKAVGEPAVVAHFHSARLSLFNVALGALELSVAPDRIYFTMGEATGNIWLAALR